jgi:two-component system, chemotaxis family, chemotaxis protein CheY
MKILIADDDPVSRAVLAKIIATQPDHQVTLAEDGREAWTLLDDPGRSFDVAFLDLSMPKIDGFELLRRIRSSPLLKSTEIVVCSGSNDRASVVKAAELGARHYLVKPCVAAAVLGKLQMLQPV